MGTSASVNISDGKSSAWFMASHDGHPCGMLPWLATFRGLFGDAFRTKVLNEERNPNNGMLAKSGRGEYNYTYNSKSDKLIVQRYKETIYIGTLTEAKIFVNKFGSVSADDIEDAGGIDEAELVRQRIDGVIEVD